MVRADREADALRDRRRAARPVRARALLARAAAQRDPDPGALQRGAGAHPSADRHPAGRDQRHPLPAARGLPRAGRAPVHRDRRQAHGREALQDGHGHALLPDARADGARVPGPAAVSLRPRWTWPSRSTSQIEFGEYHVPVFQPETGETPGRAVRPVDARGDREALRSGARPGARAPRVRARDHQRDGLHVLLPDRLGPDQVGARPRHPRRPGPRLGSGLDRRLRARHHARRPARVRPPVRALPEQRPRVDARHRHRLLQGGARARARVHARRSTARRTWPRS